MAISGITDSGASAPVNLTESTDSSAAAPANLTESVSVTSSAPNNLTEKAESSAALPVSGARVSNSGSTAPNNVTEKTVSGASVPSNLAELSDSGAAIPSSLTELSDSGASAPANLAELSDSGAIAPVNLTESTNSGALAPVSLTETVVSAFPRTMTPLVSMDFANNAYSQDNTSVAFDDLFTYARNSNATFWNRRLNKNGKWESFLDTDVVGTVTNLLTYSEQFDHVNWIKVRANITANAAANPVDGSMTVDSLTEDVTASDTHYIRYTNLPHTSGNNYTYYIYIKPNGRSEIQITLGTSAFPTSANAVFNIQAGAVVELGAGASEALITYEGDGWYKCSVSALADATVANGVVDIYLRSGGSGTYNGDGVSGVYLWGAQLTESAKPLPYVKTVSSSASDTFTEALRLEYDPVTFEAKGALIEGGANNLATRSEEMTDSWTPSEVVVSINLVTAPDGTTSADLIKPSALSTSAHQVSKLINITNDLVYTYSMYAKNGGYGYIMFSITGNDGTLHTAMFDLNEGIVGVGGANNDGSSVEDVGNGWYRCSMTITNGNGGSANTSRIRPFDNVDQNPFSGDTVKGVYVWGVQVEELPFASSYIRTEGVPVERVADGLGIDSSGNFNGDIYTADCEFDCSNNDLDLGQWVYTITTTSGTTGLAASHQTANNMRFYHDGTVISNIEPVTGQSYQMTGAFSGSTTSLYVDDIFDSSLSGAPLVAPTSIVMGTNLFGHVKYLNFFEEAMTAQEVSLL